MVASHETTNMCPNLSGTPLNIPLIDQQHFRLNKINEVKDYFVANGDFKDLARRTASDTFLRDKTFNIAKNPKCDGYQRGLASMVYKFFDKKSA